MAEIFEEQLKKCQTEYFDFYLFHNVCELNIDGYLEPKFGIFDYLMEQKRNGRIRHLGFSTHGTLAPMKRFLDAYGEHIYSGGGFIAPMAMGSLDDSKKPSACIGCGQCTQMCPQNIDIPGAMSVENARINCSNALYPIYIFAQIRYNHSKPSLGGKICGRPHF